MMKSTNNWQIACRWLLSGALLMMLNVYPCGAQTICNPGEIRTEIQIKTSPEAAWALLTDFANYPIWHPYLVKVEGELVRKKKIKATLREPEDKKFSAYILELEPNRKLAWGGSLAFIFKAKHYYYILPEADGKIRFVQGEYWRGMFGKSYGKKIYLKTFSRFEEMNRRMKVILENEPVRNN